VSFSVARRVVVIEVNELPLRLARWYADAHPRSTLSRLLEDSSVLETEVREVTGRELYPSQTWASMNTGMGFRDHGVYWYGDPKPADYPLYWQLAARAGRRVGVVGTLHSSPLAQQCAEPGMVFAIPDCFAAGSATLPVAYESFQRVNLALTHESGRTAVSRPSARQLLALARVPALGVRPSTIARVAALGARAASGRVSRERLRSAPFLLLADMFERLNERTHPELSIFFTNHVASAMHRYWYASFPDDFATPAYDDAWVQRYRGELSYAMDVLDRFLGRVLAWCEATGRVLVLDASMGQSADANVDASCHEVVVVRDADRFVQAIGVSSPYRISRAMVPQIQLVLSDAAAAAAVVRDLSAASCTGVELWVEHNGAVVTLAYRVNPTRATIEVGGRVSTLTAAGLAVQRVDDHRSGDHSPRGVLLVHGAAVPWTEPTIDALEVAPFLLDLLGVARPAHLCRDATSPTTDALIGAP
jgi:hypothetical protein